MTARAVVVAVISENKIKKRSEKFHIEHSEYLCGNVKYIMHSTTINIDILI